MSRSSLWIVWSASALALFLAGTMIFSAAFGYGQVVLVPLAALPLAVGIGILRHRAWYAYGLALYLCGQLLVAGVRMLRDGAQANLQQSAIPAIVLLILLIALYFFAGRALRSTGSHPGSAIPWIVLTALFTLPVFFVEAFSIPSAAMENTLLVGDRILVRRIPRPKVQRGDIVVFLYPLNHQETYVKRLIGMPGDRIRISNKVLYRNGVAQTEPYAVHKTDYLDSYRDNFPSEANAPLPEPALEMLRNHNVNGEITVPAGKYFVLGDNRDNSADSRYWGFVPDSDLIGEPVLIYDSEDQAPEDLTRSTVPVRRRVRWERFFKPL